MTSSDYPYCLHGITRLLVIVKGIRLGYGYTTSFILTIWYEVHYTQWEAMNKRMKLHGNTILKPLMSSVMLIVSAATFHGKHSTSLCVSSHVESILYNHQ